MDFYYGDIISQDLQFVNYFYAEMGVFFWGVFFNLHFLWGFLS